MSNKLVNVKTNKSNSISVTLINDTITHSSHIGLLPSTILTRQMQLVHLFPGSKKVLLLLGQFCDVGMRIILTRYDLLEVMGDKSQEVVL